MSEAILVRDRHDARITLAAAASPGEVYQMNDGRAGVLAGGTAGASGDNRQFATEGQFTVTKTASQVWLDGAPIWWDHSANSATCLPASADRDFYLGVAVGDAASADTTGVVNLNVQPNYFIELSKDAFRTIIVKTVVGSTTVEVPQLYQRGASNDMIFGTTAEAQKVDLLSVKSFALASNWIVEGTFTVVTDFDAAAADLNIGVANATHASDADAITESVFFHTDGGSANILAESDDGTTEVAATDTTIDYAAGTQVHFALDGRDPSDVKFYLNGAEVLNGTADLGNIAAATGPLKLLAHMEKSADDTPGDVAIDRFTVRLAQVD